MKSHRSTITSKAVIGYLLLTSFAVFAVWFVYGQVVEISENTRRDNYRNQRLFLIGQIATNLYDIEGLGRDIIQNQDIKKLSQLQSHIDTTNHIIDSLKNLDFNFSLKRELDSLTHYLTQKGDNVIELLELRAMGSESSYYARVLSRLEEMDNGTIELSYEEQLQKFDPTVRKAIIGLIEYSENKYSEEQQTQRSSDSMLYALKTILRELEAQEQSLFSSINRKEGQLLESDRSISRRLNNLRSAIEQEEMRKRLEEVTQSQVLLRRTSFFIAAVGAVSILTIIYFVHLILRDANRAKRYKQELVKAKDYAETLMKTREQIMKAVTHDLRSPLNSVVGFSGLLGNTALKEKQKHYLTHLQNASQYALRLVNDLLDFSKIEAGKLTVEKIPFYLRQVVEESIKNTIPVADPKNLSVQVEIDTALDREIVSDPFRLQQILSNLLSNAYKFTNQGSICVQGQLSDSNEGRQMMTLVVADTGSGIPEAFQGRIFEEFYQAENKAIKRYDGYGLGLSIAKKLALLLEGDITFKSQEETGTVFTVRLPMEYPKPVKNTVKSEENHKQPVPIGKRILVVDDAPDQLELAFETITRLGHQVETGQSVAEAIKHLGNQPFDLVLTDVQMPDEDGFQLMKKIKADPGLSHIPVIALSGRVQLTEADYKKAGFWGYIPKPYLWEDLKEKVSGALSENRTSSETSDRLFNLTDLRGFTQGDDDFLKRTLQSFVESCLQNMVVLKKFASEADFEQLSRTAHRMLPMFRQLHINRCVDDLEKIENKDVKPAAIGDCIEELSRNMQAVTNQIDDYINS